MYVLDRLAAGGGRAVVGLIYARHALHAVYIHVLAKVRLDVIYVAACAAVGHGLRIVLPLLLHDQICASHVFDLFLGIGVDRARGLRVEYA